MIGKRRLGAWLLWGIALGLVPAACGRSDGGLGSEPDTGSSGESGAAGDSTSETGAGGATANDTGTGGAVEVGGAAEFAGAGGTETDDCQPGTLSCDGPSVRVCRPDGHGRTIQSTCSLSQECSAGKCIDIVCAPDSTSCEGGSVWKCSKDGLFKQLSTQCEEDQFCIVRDGEATCNPTACVAGDPVCDGQVATHCRADGSGPKAGGQDCAADGLVCHDGVCLAQGCTPGKKLCEHDDVYLCGATGTDEVLFTACAADEVCDPARAACRRRLCDPGTLDCDASRVVTCNDLGIGWDQAGQDCATNGQLCVNGTCKPQVCTPNNNYCQDNGIYLCNGTGDAGSLVQQCVTGTTYCYGYYANYFVCQPDACTPTASVCNNNTLTTCKADGSGPAPGGTDCGNDQVCDSGSCKDLICQPYSYFCDGNDVAYCGYNGLSSSTEQVCGDAASCQLVGNSFVCKPFLCTPGKKACFGDQVGTCNADGFSIGAISDDCSGTGKVCTTANSCATSAVDTLGDAEELQSLVSDTMFGDVIDVVSSRKLTRIDANLVLASARDLRWIVYELVGDYYVSRYDKVVSGQTGTGYLSSGSLDYTLKANTRYLIAVAVTGGGFVPYYDAQPWTGDASFGKTQGGLTESYSTSLWAYYFTPGLIYDLRLTTTSP